jgi:hypothetical protein
MTENKAPVVMWRIEFENSGHSAPDASEAWMVLVGFQSRVTANEPAASPTGIVRRSNGLRFATPMKNGV